MTVQKPKEETELTTEELLGRLQSEVAEVLESALGEHVISESPHQRTGGAYQTIRLGDIVRGGFRAARQNLLAGFDVEDRYVCDLGANLGEISRDLKRAGAFAVDAYEYDPFFTQLARYATAYNGVPDVNHFEANVAEPGFMRREYHLCVGLSAFSFMRRNIDYICRQVSEGMLIETHQIVDAGWPDHYVAPIAGAFPHWCCFARVSHGRRDTGKHRLWLAFSKNDLVRFYAQRARSLSADGEGVIHVDLPRSKLTFLDKAAVIFEHRDDPLSKASLDAYRDRLAEHERRLEADAYVNLSMSGEAYWLALMCGVSRFRSDGRLDDDNPYLPWLTRGIAAGVVDRGLRHLLGDRGRLHETVEARLAWLAQALEHRDVGHFVDIPIAYNATPFHPSLEELSLKTLVLSESGEKLSVPVLNGHHRLFVMRLLEIPSCPMMTIWDHQWNLKYPAARRVQNYEQRMYQYLAGVEVDDPVLAE
jgi:hypothetical protein